MKKLAYQVAGYGLISIAGGIHGYTQGSTASLVAGGSLGTFLLVGSFGLKGERDWGWWISLVVTVILLSKFMPEFKQSGDLYPAGLMSSAGIWVLGALIVDSLNKRAV